MQQTDYGFGLSKSSQKNNHPQTEEKNKISTVLEAIFQKFRNTGLYTEYLFQNPRTTKYFLKVSELQIDGEESKMSVVVAAN